MKKIKNNFFLIIYSKYDFAIVHLHNNLALI